MDTDSFVLLLKIIDKLPVFNLCLSVFICGLINDAEYSLCWKRAQLASIPSATRRSHWRSLSAIELNTNVPAEFLAADVEVGVGLRVDDADAFLRFADVDDAVAFQV